MKKKTLLIKKLLFALLFLCALCLFLGWLSRLLIRKDSYQKYEPFYEADENFDVLFFGTSHGCNGFAPMELWDSYGIASYNLSQHSEYMAVTYYQVLNALTFTNPELIVIDPYLVGTTDKIPGNKADWSYVHDSLDAMPLSLVKWNAVQDLLPDFEAKAEFLFPFIMYHNRWDALTETDFTPDYNMEKGSESRIGNTRLADFTPISQDQAYDLSEADFVGLHYLDLIIEECKKKDIDVLLAVLPYQADENSQLTANGLRDYATEKGVGYVNLFYENPMNYSTDFYDGGHLNPSGYKKAADFLGQYLTENYEIPDRREDSAYAGWYQDYEIYAAMQIDTLRETDDFYTYFTLLQNKNVNVTIRINPDCGFLGNSYVPPYLYNLGITTDLAKVKEDGLSFYAEIDKVNGTVHEEAVEYSPDYGQSSYMYVTVTNNRTGEVVDERIFYENTYYEWTEN